MGADSAATAGAPVFMSRYGNTADLGTPVLYLLRRPSDLGCTVAVAQHA